MTLSTIDSIISSPTRSTPSAIPPTPSYPPNQTLNPLRSHPDTLGTSLKSLKFDRTSEWASSLTPLPPADSSEDLDVSDEARDRSRFSETIVRLTTSPDIVRDGEMRPRSGDRPWSPENEFGGRRPGSDSSSGGLLKVGSNGTAGRTGKSRIRMLTDEERMRKEIEMLETPVERIGRKRPGGWRWWFGID